MEGFKAAIALPPSDIFLAPFFGQYIAILATSGNGFVMARETDCSLTAFNVPYSATTDSPYTAYDSGNFNYGPILHSDAGLTTTGGIFEERCADPKIGIESGSLVYPCPSFPKHNRCVRAGKTITQQRTLLFVAKLLETAALKSGAQEKARPDLRLHSGSDDRNPHHGLLDSNYSWESR